MYHKWMNAKQLSQEIRQSLETATMTLIETIKRDGIKEVMVDPFLDALANNLAAGLADRTISEKTAGRLAKAGIELEQLVKDELFEKEQGSK